MSANWQVRRLIWLIFPKAALLLLAGQNGSASQVPIVTDRPDFTESSLVVPARSTQIESGFTWTRDSSGDKSLSGPEILARIGMSERLELRLGMPNYNWIDSRGLPQSRGWDDLYLGVKYQLGPTSDGTGLALIPAVFVPVGREGIRSEAVSPELKFVWSRELPADKALSGMIYIAGPEVNGKRVDLLQHTISIGLPVAEKLGMFIEHVLNVSRGAYPSQMLHSGFTYQPRSNTQFDVHFGFGLTPNAPSYFIAGGYSIRL
jgi:hypothetical protein